MVRAGVRKAKRLQLRITKAVYQSFNAVALFAEGAVFCIVALIVRQIFRTEYRLNGNVFNRLHIAVDGRHTFHDAAIILDTFDALVDGFAGSDRSHQNEHVLAADHRLDVVPENQLAVGIVFRRDHINTAMRIQRHKTAVGEFVGKAGADDFGSVQTNNGIHNGSGHIMLHQCLGYAGSFAQTAFQGGDVDIIIDVAVVGGEMALYNLKGYSSVVRINFDHAIFH